MNNGRPGRRIEDVALCFLRTDVLLDAVHRVDCDVARERRAGARIIRGRGLILKGHAADQVLAPDERIITPLVAPGYRVGSGTGVTVAQPQDN